MGGMVRRRVLRIALGLLPLIASSCAFPVSDPVYGPGAHDQRTPAIATDGTNFFVVWADLRHSPRATNNYDIYGARIAPDGSVLDVTGIPIARGPAFQSDPDVAFDGTNFLVVWRQRAAGSSASDIVGARVSPDGDVLDPVGIAVSTNGGSKGPPAVSAGAGSALVVWERCDLSVSACGPTVEMPLSPAAIEGARVAPTGAVLDPIPIPIAGTVRFSFAAAPHVAFDGVNHLVLWERPFPFPPLQYDIVARRVSSLGAVVGDAFTIAATAADEEDPRVGFDGTNYLAVWNQDPVSADGRVRGARISPGAVVLDSSGFDISTARGSAPEVVFDGTNHLIAWADPTGAVNDGDPLLGRRVSPDGDLVDPAALSLGDGAGPALGANAGSTILAFVAIELDGFLRPGEIRATRIGGATPLDSPPFTVTNPANDQLTPAITFDGTNHFVVWADQRLGFEYDVFAARVRADGTMLDGTGVAISTAAGNELDPSVAFDGTGYFAVWEHHPATTGDDDRVDVFGTRVSAAGDVLDPEGIPIATTSSKEIDPVVVFDGMNYIVSWGLATGGIRAARVSPSGAVLDPAGLSISPEGISPAIAHGDGASLVVWREGDEIIGARVANDGTLLEPAGLPISNTAHALAEPAVAFNGANYLVAWDDNRHDLWGDIFATRVTSDGAVLDPSGIAVSTSMSSAGLAEREPAVAANGTTFLVTWRDDRRRGVAAEGPDIFGARVDNDGVVLDPSGISITDTPAYASDPAVAPGQGDGWEVAYRLFAAEQRYGADRVFHRTVSPG